MGGVRTGCPRLVHDWSTGVGVGGVVDSPCGVAHEPVSLDSSLSRFHPCHRGPRGGDRLGWTGVEVWVSPHTVWRTTCDFSFAECGEDRRISLRTSGSRRLLGKSRGTFRGHIQGLAGCLALPNRIATTPISRAYFARRFSLFHRTTTASIKEHASVLSLTVPFVAKVRAWAELGGVSDHWLALSGDRRTHRTRTHTRAHQPTHALTHELTNSRSTHQTLHARSLQPRSSRTRRPSVSLRAWAPCCGCPVPVRWELGRWEGWRGWGRPAWPRGRRLKFAIW